jgi:cell division cycle 20, cofactor of APC complex
MDLSHHLLQSIENKSTSKVLNLHLKSNNDLISSYKSQTNNNKSCGKKRSISANAERVLDAPELRNDFYLNLIDWSVNNIISVPLNQELFLWDENCLKSTLLFKMTDQYLIGYLASTSWMKTKGF